MSSDFQSSRKGINSILLAGGNSTRFGEDKARTALGNEIMIRRIVEKLRSVSDKVYVVANDPSSYSFLNTEIIKDIIPNQGPLGGLYTGLRYSNSLYNFVLPCDMPLITQNYLEYLKSHTKDYDALVPKYNGYMEPLAGIYSKNCVGPIQKQINRNNLSLKSFFPDIKVKTISEKQIKEIEDPDRLFCNINYTKDLKKAKKMMEELNGAGYNRKN